MMVVVVKVLVRKMVVVVMGKDINYFMLSVFYAFTSTLEVYVHISLT